MQIKFYMYVVSFLVLRFEIHSQTQFTLPLTGVYGQQFIIVNYVDWGPGTTIKDSHCDSKTYDGHQGTDFVIRDFKMMDAGVNVVAAKKGKVIFVQEGLFDREKTSVISKQLGNYVAIAHSGSVQTYYAHLRKGSITVAVGDSVIAGQKLGLVGSSGNSESPHLHFECWFDSTYYFDPFTGICGNSVSSWINEPAFNSSFASWTSGMINYVPTLDTLKEGLSVVDTFNINDAAVTYWNLESGLRTNDSLKIEWFDPNGTLWFKYGYKVDRDWWYYYYSTYINAPVNGPAGKWSLKHYKNNILVENRFFYFKKGLETGIIETSLLDKQTVTIKYLQDAVLLNASTVGGAFHIYNLQGKLLKTLNFEGAPLLFVTKNIAEAICIVEYQVHKKIVVRKKLVIAR